MKSKIRDIFPLVARMDNIQQWEELDINNRESISQHSYKVAAFTAILLEEVFNGIHSSNVSDFINRTLCHAIFHDVDESLFLRDVSQEVKYNEYNGVAIRSAIRSYCEEVFLKNFDIYDKVVTDVETMLYRSIFSNDFSLSHKFVKFCDWLAMCHYVVRELRLGNANFYSKVENCKNGILTSGGILIDSFKKSEFSKKVDIRPIQDSSDFVIYELNKSYEKKENF